ncbi:NAD(P)H-binding protein [Mycobacterium intracellulare]|uniref:NmrA family NAD(P)-binding protein n=1 Tax=Mycobacterium intracellulare TaxID=1767 RepID=UPI0004502928|nr:NAD(P)H-binding protein [Mycobacterium intracellulare]ETZ36115.1 nmrA-like family protein [Mycobacterium intracellulare MIN_061107_1834]MCA2273950.1 NAD(P)H-binding protein [Mycobacterium intracellulare]MCA2324671.1 NAD(P)H-binding protein [Mycobacterium intracellulare]UEB22628.1 NAD(P)H-binding protein [Mycobacterium intracellulare]WVL05610.1 NAD(P)H-binding protein [Mycobacterium intracellulare]
MSNDELYLITAATGKTGVHAVRTLREQGKQVRALVHRIDDRSRQLAELGADVAIGDLLDFAAVSSAMAGVTAAYFCYPIHPGLLDATAIFAQAATEAGVRAVVNMSQISARRDAKSHAAQNHWLSERVLDRSAFITTHLRPTFFAEWLAWQWARDEDGGVLRLPFADGRHAPIAAMDQARVIATILRNPLPHDRQAYPLYGPVELDHHQIAEKMATVLGFPVRYEPIEIGTFAEVLKLQGADEYFIQHLTNVAQDYRDGVFAGADNRIEVITGTPAATVEQITAANSAAFSGAGQESVWQKLPGDVRQ